MPALAFLAFLINFLIAFLDSINNFLDITMTTFNSNNNFLDSILNNLHKDVEDIIKRKMESSLEKIQPIYKDELQVLRKELESKNSIINKLLETIENIGNKAVQPNPLPIPKRHLEDTSNDTSESDRKDNQEDSQQEMNNLNLGNSNSIKNNWTMRKGKKGKNIISIKTTFEVMLLKKV